jgi:hypothetical protein
MLPLFAVLALCSVELSDDIALPAAQQLYRRKK